MKRALETLEIPATGGGNTNPPPKKSHVSGMMRGYEEALASMNALRIGIPTRFLLPGTPIAI